MHRRQFLHSATATLALAKVPEIFALPEGAHYRADIGIQLYTLRNEIGKDPVATLQAVAAAGYKQIEPFNFPDAAPMMDAARAAGLAIRSAHFQWDSVIHPKDEAMSDFAAILGQAHTAGLSHLVIPYLKDEDRKTADDYKKIAAHANKAAAMCKSAGIRLCYHNHNFEFGPLDGGKTGYEIFIEEFSNDMHFEIDVFWVKAGGSDPVALIDRLKGRVAQLHLKDLKAGIPTPSYQTNLPAEAFQELGDGVIPMEPILAAASRAGVTHCHVEQDQSPDALASIRQSMEYLRKL